MSFQGKVLHFTISDQGEFRESQTATFEGNSITGSQAWACLQSIDVSYKGNSAEHNRGISKFIPTVGSISGTNVSVELDMLYADDDPSKHTMTGTVSVLVLADVN